MSEFPSRFNALKNATALTQRIVVDSANMVAAYIRCFGNTSDYPDPAVTIGAGTNQATSVLTFYSNYSTGAVVDTDIATVGIGTAGVVGGSSGTYAWAATKTFAQVAALLAQTKAWRMVLVAARPDLSYYDLSSTTTSVSAITSSSPNTTAFKNCRNGNGTPLLMKINNGSLGTYEYGAICCGLEAEDGTDQVAAGTATLGTAVTGTPTFGDVLGRQAGPTVVFGTKDIAKYQGLNGAGGAEVSSVGYKATALRWLTAKQTGVADIKIYGCTQTASRLIHTVAYPSTGTTQVSDFSDSNWVVTLPGERMVIEVGSPFVGDTIACVDPILQGDYGVGIPN